MDAAHLPRYGGMMLRWHRAAALSWPHLSAAMAIAIVCACIVNAYSYTLVVANPLVQSDVWRLLDGFLGRFIDYGFSWQDVFVEPAASNTNFPLYKLFLLFNTRYFAMDLRLEAVLAILAGIGCMLLLARMASARPWTAWRARECWLLAALALAMLSLNSPNLYAWPLALSWYVPILLACAYFGTVHQVQWPMAAAATFVLGVLLDEFAYPVVAAALLAWGMLRWRDWRPIRISAAGILVGLLGSRMFYALWDATATQAIRAAAGDPVLQRSFGAFLSPELWKAAIVPLSNSLVHADNLGPVFGAYAQLARWTLALGLLVAHGWFWWQVARIARRGDGDLAAYLAVAIMLFFYAMVAGVVLQRVPEHGFDYLDQPRYVLFYQLNLVGLALLAYSCRCGASADPSMRTRLTHAVLPACLVLGLVLQACLSAHAWAQAKYISLYLQEAARDMGRIAANPDAQITCLPIVRVCDFTVEKRRRIMARLLDNRLNLFSSDFQAMYRMYPDAGAIPPEIAGSGEPPP